MSKKDVTRFNIICGNAPSMGSDFEYWRQIRNQAERIYEEAKELLAAAKAEDMVQVLDGWADVMYTNEYMDDLLKAGEVNTKAAWEAVCANNNQKFTTSYTYALGSKEHLEGQGVDCFIEETAFEGEIYYTVRRMGDLKILKLKHHEQPSIGQFVPEEFR